MINKESDIRPIGYGAMLLEGFVSLTALIAACALEPGDYYIKVSVESILRKLPPGIDTVVFWVSTKEFSISKDSPLFRIPAVQEAR